MRWFNLVFQLLILASCELKLQLTGLVDLLLLWADFFFRLGLRFNRRSRWVVVMMVAMGIVVVQVIVRRRRGIRWLSGRRRCVRLWRRGVWLWGSIDRLEMWSRWLMVMVTVARVLPWVPSIVKFCVDAGQDVRTWPDHFLRERELLAVEYESCSVLRDRLFNASQGVVEIVDTGLL